MANRKRNIQMKFDVTAEKNKSYSSRSLWFENGSYFVRHAIGLLFRGVMYVFIPLQKSTLKIRIIP